MVKLLMVGMGGFMGSVARYLLSGLVHRLLNNAWFPYGTLAVNVCGCFLIGFLGGLSDSRQVFSPEIRLFLFLGVLGGFTTFSTFGYETISLARNSATLAFANVAVQIVLGLGAVWFGNGVSRIF